MARELGARLRIPCVGAASILHPSLCRWLETWSRVYVVTTTRRALLLVRSMRQYVRVVLVDETPHVLLSCPTVMLATHGAVAARGKLRQLVVAGCAAGDFVHIALSFLCAE